MSVGVRLFCLPHAGGGAHAFLGWPTVLPRSVTVEPVHLPGRETRGAEPPEFDVEDVADQVAARIDGPYALFGHSMGARLAFEVARTLIARGLPAPRRLYLSAARPPADDEAPTGLDRLSDEELIGRITDLGGTPPLVFRSPELRSATLRVLRADLGWLDRYPYRPGPALAVPIVCFAAVADPSLPATDMVGWQRHTTRSFRLHTHRGGHFFVTTELRAVAATIAADLVGDHARPAVAIRLPEPDEVHVFADPAPERSESADNGALRRVLARYGATVGTPTGVRVGVHRGEGARVVVAHRGREAVAVRITAPGGRMTPPDRSAATVHLELPGATCTLALPVPGARLRYETAEPAPR
jgi:surfactin synthase thioesterase subunit